MRADAPLFLGCGDLLLPLGLQLLGDLFGPLLDALHAHLVVAVPLLQVLHRGEDRVLHLPLLLGHLLVKLWVQTLQSRRVVLLLAWGVEVHTRPSIALARLAHNRL